MAMLEASNPHLAVTQGIAGLGLEAHWAGEQTAGRLTRAAEEGWASGRSQIQGAWWCFMMFLGCLGDSMMFYAICFFVRSYKNYNFKLFRCRCPSILMAAVGTQLALIDKCDPISSRSGIAEIGSRHL